MMYVLYLCHLTPHREKAARGSGGTVHANLTEAGVNVASGLNNFALHTLPFPVREYKLESDILRIKADEQRVFKESGLASLIETKRWRSR
jgi:hypothetical protein